MYDPAIHRRKTVVMQRIQQLSVRGYRWYIRGEVTAERALNLAAKFAEKYGVGMNENQRSYAKRKGKENAFLLMRTKKMKALFYGGCWPRMAMALFTRRASSIRHRPASSPYLERRL